MHPMETLKQLDIPTKVYTKYSSRNIKLNYLVTAFQFVLMDLSDGSVIDGFESSDPSLVFATHHMNAWEEGEEVVFDLATNPWDMLATYLEVYICIFVSWMEHYKI